MRNVLFLFLTLFQFTHPVFAEEPAGDEHLRPDAAPDVNVPRPVSEPSAELKTILPEDKVKKLEELAGEFQRNGTADPYPVFDEVFDSEDINLTAVVQALSTKPASSGYEMLKFLVGLEERSPATLMQCLELIANVTPETSAESLAFTHHACGMNEKFEKNVVMQTIVSALQRKAMEWSYILGVSPDEARVLLIDLDSRLKTNDPEQRAANLEAAGKILAQYFGSKPAASIEYIKERLKNVPVSEDSKLLRELFLAGIEWSKERKEKEGEVLRSAFNEAYFADVKENRDKFWSLVDAVKKDMNKRDELLKQYSDHLPTFIRTLTEQANGSDAAAAAKAKKMLDDVMAAVMVSQDGGKKVLVLEGLAPIAYENDPKNLVDVTKFQEDPRFKRFVPREGTAPQIYSTRIQGSPNPSGYQEPLEDAATPSESTGGETQAAPGAPDSNQLEIDGGQLLGFIKGNPQETLAKIYESSTESEWKGLVKQIVDANQDSMLGLEALENLTSGLGDKKHKEVQQTVDSKVKAVHEARIREIESKLDGPAQAALTGFLKVDDAGTENPDFNAKLDVLTQQPSDVRELVNDYLYSKVSTDPKWEASFGEFAKKRVTTANEKLKTLPNMDGDLTARFTAFIYETSLFPRNSYPFQSNTLGIRTFLAKNPQATPTIRALVDSLELGEKGEWFFKDLSAPAKP